MSSSFLFLTALFLCLSGDVLSFSKVCHPHSFPLWMYTPSRSHSFGAERDTPSLECSPEFLSVRCINPSLPLSHSIFLSLVHYLFFCRSVLILSPWLLFIAGEERALVAVSVLRVCVWDMFVKARHISLGWWWGICERVCVCVAVGIRALRRWQSCAGRVKMMAVVRTSLQKVVVFLHRLQRMAISSPRYQKLYKVSVLCTRSLKRFHLICASLR